MLVTSLKERKRKREGGGKDKEKHIHSFKVKEFKIIIGTDRELGII